MSERYDVAVIGMGVFGAWTAYFLRKAKLRVIAVDAHGPAYSRSSSGGETRITRMAYGGDELYSRWALESLEDWLALEQRCGQKLFHQTGVLTFSDEKTHWVQRSAETIRYAGGECELIPHEELCERFPHIRFTAGEIGVLEPKSGALIARRAVQLLVGELVAGGMTYQQAAISPPSGGMPVVTSEGETITATHYVFACGPWLAKVFPSLLSSVIKPVRAEVYFLGIPGGSHEFDASNMPTWIFMGDENWDAYGMPDLESRGFKLAVDRIQRPADPDTMDRQPTAPFLEQVRDFVRQRFPKLANSPVVETRVCQYEKTPSHHYLIDRHPNWKNAWLVGGGSGHGFKNGPAIGRYVADAIINGAMLKQKFRLPAH
jgi:monomeric sarcosine oxidase